MQDRLTIAFYQQDICWENPEANFARVAQAFGSLSQQCDILVVPETFSTGFSDNMARMAEPPEGSSYQFALRMAQQHNALFVGTWTVREGGKVFNRLHWVRPDGTYGCYDKGHTFRMSTEATQLARGIQRQTFEWRGWRIKPAICYDLRFPKWLRNANCGEVVASLAPDAESLHPQLDYDLLLICANWPASRHEAWSTLLKARAIENLSYVVGVNRVGIDGVDIPYSGNSAAINFKGQEMVVCEPGLDQVQVATLDAASLLHFRQHWPFFLDFD